MNGLQDCLSLSYGEMEQLNLEAKEQRLSRTPPDKIQEQRLKYLTDEKRIKAVTLLFSDLEARLHMLDYDKNWLAKSWDNMTFDGSSIRRIHGPARKRSAAGRRLGLLLLGAGGCFRAGQGNGLWRGARQGWNAVRRRSPQRSQVPR